MDEKVFWEATNWLKIRMSKYSIYYENELFDFLLWEDTRWYIYYRFIVLFSDRVGLPLHNIDILHLLLSWTSSFSILSSAISTSTLSNHVFLDLPTDTIGLYIFFMCFSIMNWLILLLDCVYTFLSCGHVESVIGSMILVNVTSISLDNLNVSIWFSKYFMCCKILMVDVGFCFACITVS